jgi:DNA polymerase delta subunit 1
VGGLMKFAVKTVTCMGCKTALKPSNSVPSKWMSLVTHAAC